MYKSRIIILCTQCLQHWCLLPGEQSSSTQTEDCVHTSYHSHTHTQSHRVGSWRQIRVWDKANAYENFNVAMKIDNCQYVIYCISLIKRCGYYFFRCSFLHGYYSKAVFISLESPYTFTDGWIRYVQVIQRWLVLDAVSSACSLSVMHSTVEMSRTTQTALEQAWLPSSELIHTRVRVPCICSPVPRCGGGGGERAPGTHCLRMCLIIAKATW